MLARKLLATPAFPVWAINLSQSSSQNLNWAPTLAATGGTKTWTAAFWIYLTAVSPVAFPFYCGPNDPSETMIEIGGSSPAAVTLENSGASFTTSQTLTYNAWHHVCVTYNSTVPALKIYIDGVLCTGYGAPALGATTYFGSSTNFQLGNPSEGGSEGEYLFAGQMADPYFVDGLGLSASNFIDGAGNPVRFTGPFGNNGFHLPFSNGATLGADASGNGNSFTVSGSISQSATQGILYPGKTTSL